MNGGGWTSIFERRHAHCKNKFAVLANYLVTTVV